jgi:hypothetical protein
MGGIVKTGNVAHDNAVLAAEVTRQNAVNGLAQNALNGLAMSPPGAFSNAEIAYCRAVIASCKANDAGEMYINTLKALGTGGS